MTSLAGAVFSSEYQHLRPVWNSTKRSASEIVVCSRDPNNFERDSRIEGRADRREEAISFVIGTLFCV